MQVTSPRQIMLTDDRRAAGFRLSFLATFASAASILLSIALSQLLLAVAIVAFAFSGRRIRFPRIWIPLLIFFSLTVISALLSPDPEHGFPQIRKFYVLAILPLVFTTFTTRRHIVLLVAAWSGLSLLSAIRSIFEYIHRYQLALQQYAYDYGFFLDGRIKGFASHWMTFGGEQMIVFLLLFSGLLFAARGRWRVYGSLCALVIFVSIVLGLTRSIFLLGMPAGALYLVWHWKRWVVAAIPSVLLIELFLGPVQVRERVVSAVIPHRELDSNSHRIITERTGWEMVRKHPWFGLGPEQVGPQFLRYAPLDIPRPLPKGYYGHLHNIYLQYSAERGVPALITLLWLIGRALTDFYRGAKTAGRKPEHGFILHGAVAVLIAVLLEGFFEYNLGDSEVLTLVAATIAIGYRVLQWPIERRPATLTVPDRGVVFRKEDLRQEASVAS